MRNVRRSVFGAALLITTSCSNGSTSATPPIAIADIAKVAKLQFAVGTATIGTTTGTITGTNFVSTFRGSNGLSATLANTPTLTGPPNFVIGFPGSLNSLTGVLPNVLNQALLATQSGALYPTSFAAGLGPLIGVFGYGMAGDNLLSAQASLQLTALSGKTSGGLCPDMNVKGQNTEGSPLINGAGVLGGVSAGGLVPLTSEAESQELGLPLGSGSAYFPANGIHCPVSALSPNGQSGVPATQDFPINYYGGPPAWPSPQGYGTASFFIGYPVGFTDFTATPVLGKYSLDVAFATNTASTTYGHVDASAALTSATPLPPLTITSATVHPDGTGSVVLTVPPGLFETIIFVRALDCGPPGASLDNYAIVTHSSGSQNVLFGARLGPPDASGQPRQTFCTSAGVYSATAFAVGFDYPAYESSYPFNVTQTPKLTNGDGFSGQADVTTSAAFPFSFTVGP